MRCVRCRSEAVTERPERTAHGYRRFRCHDCAKQFNERTGTVLNRAQYPSDVVALVVLWRLRYKLSLRDLPEMSALRGMVFCHEAVRDWEAKLTPAMAEELLRRRRGKAGRSWYTDETCLKVAGRWCYVYRAIDSSGALVDVLSSERRDMAAAKGVLSLGPDGDGHRAAPGDDGRPRQLPARHRSELGRITAALKPIPRLRGFKCPRAAARFGRGHDELRNFLRAPSRHNQRVPAFRRRLLHLRRTVTVLAILEAA